MASPAASADRPKEDHFGDRIAALTGAEQGVRPDALLPARARLRYAALYASPRSPAAIQDALADLMRAPVRIVEHVPRWRDVEPDERSRAGRGFANLGRDAVAGGRVRTVSDAFRVVISVPSAEVMNELLPGGRRYALLVEALDAFAPPHLEWDIELEVSNRAIRPARLGGGGRNARQHQSHQQAVARLAHGPVSPGDRRAGRAAAVKPFSRAAPNCRGSPAGCGGGPSPPPPARPRNPARQG